MNQRVSQETSIQGTLYLYDFLLYHYLQNCKSLLVYHLFTFFNSTFLVPLSRFPFEFSHVTHRLTLVFLWRHYTNENIRKKRDLHKTKTKTGRERKGEEREGTREERGKERGNKIGTRREQERGRRGRKKRQNPPRRPAREGWPASPGTPPASPDSGGSPAAPTCPHWPGNPVSSILFNTSKVVHTSQRILNHSTPSSKTTLSTIISTSKNWNVSSFVMSFCC